MINYSYRRVCQADIADILICFNEVFDRNLDPAYYEWKYGGLSSYTSFIALYKSRIVAHVAYSYADYIYSDDSILAARRHTSFVSPEHRGKGVFGKLLIFSSDELFRDKVRLVIGYPNMTNLRATVKNRQTVPLVQLPLLRRIARDKADLTPDFFLDSSDLFISLSDYLADASDVDKIGRFEPAYSLRKDFRYLQYRYLDDPSSTYYVHSLGDSLIVLKGVLFSEVPTIAIMDVIGEKDEISLNIIKVSSFIPQSFQMISLCNFSDATLIESYLKSGFIFSEPVFSLVLLDLYDNLLTSSFYENREFMSFNIGDTDVI